MTGRRTDAPDPGPGERRRYLELREVIQELLDHIRTLAQSASSMSDTELEYAQQRLEWLADEAWRAVIEGDAAAPPDPG